MSKVVVISNANSRIGIKVPELMFNREWSSRGAKIAIDREVFEQLMYDNGVRYMFESGLLYVEDMELKKEIGLEPEDAEEPVNIIILSDADKERLLIKEPNWKFEKEYMNLTYEEQQNVADYAIENEILPSVDKCELIRKTAGKDIMMAIRLERANKEA